MYTTILAPLDGSHRAEKILSHVELLAEKFGATLVLLRVIEPLAAELATYAVVPTYDAGQPTRLQEEANAYLADLQSKYAKKGIATKTCVENGAIITSILAVAEREKADLIAMASHGRTGLARVFYGSVAAGMLNQADRPLLLIRAQD